MTCLKLKIHSKILTFSPATTEPLEISKTVPSTWKLQQARTIFNKFHRTAVTHIALTNGYALIAPFLDSIRYILLFAVSQTFCNHGHRYVCHRHIPPHFSKGFDYATFRVFSLPSVWKELPGPLSARRPLFSSFFRELCTHRSVP